MAQSVKRPTLGFGSGHDLAVHGFEPHMDLLEILSASPLLTVFLSLKNKQINLKKYMYGIQALHLLSLLQNPVSNITGSC